ncbi:MAG: hypothetical protein KGJ97_04445, partial [Xanthomonadaceae bacterium]|nr:hypothetical protein [Xanthomonadaceae bacterium]
GMPGGGGRQSRRPDLFRAGAGALRCVRPGDGASGAGAHLGRFFLAAAYEGLRFALPGKDDGDTLELLFDVDVRDSVRRRRPS